MGHANVRNLSDFFVRRLYAKGKLSLKEVAEAAAKAGVKLHASEGLNEEPEALAIGFEAVIEFLHQPECSCCESPDGPIIVPAYPLTEAQDKSWNDVRWEDPMLLKGWRTSDTIQWKFAPGWRKRYPNIPKLGYMSN